MQSINNLKNNQKERNMPDKAAEGIPDVSCQLNEIVCKNMKKNKIKVCTCTYDFKGRQ